MHVHADADQRDNRDDEAEGLEVGRASWMTWSVIGIATLATVVLGIFPGPLLDLAQQASGFLR